jgi:hypothetical protein
MDPTTNMCEAELLLAALEPYPIIGASAQWCTQLGVKEPELKGCGFKVFDADFRGLTQVQFAYPPLCCAPEPTPKLMHQTC